MSLPAVMDLKRWALEGDYCDCFFNKTEVKKNGGWEQGEANNLAAHEPIRCQANCRTQFLEIVSADYTETFSNVCTELSTKGPNQYLWLLYWCDSTYCGVGIDQETEEGQDPNVDWIINTCNNIGYHSVFDPGPPPPTYKCLTNTNHLGSGSAALCANVYLPAQASAASEANAAQTSTWESTILATQSGAPTKTTPGTGIPAAVQGGPSPSRSESSTALWPNGPLTTSAEVAVALSSVLGFLLIACLVLFLLRRQRLKRNKSALPSAKNRIRYPYHIPRAGSPTPPLVPPSTSRPPLTPPLRLRDRKYLPSILHQSRPPSPPLMPLDPAHVPGQAVFPSSPICSPTVNRHVPRHERTPKFYAPPSTNPSSASSLPPLPPAPAYLTDRDCGSRASTSTFAPSTKSTVSTAGGHSIFLSSIRNETVSLLSIPPPPPPPPRPLIQTSPTRPPRPHEAPLVIPDLVSPASPTPCVVSPTAVSTPASPAGPPPTRALPARPVQTPAVVMDGTDSGPSFEQAARGGWVAQKIRGRGQGISSGPGQGESQGRTVELELGGKDR